MNAKTLSQKFFLLIPVILLLAAGCSQPQQEAMEAPGKTEVNPDYAIASPEYAELGATAVDHLVNFRFDEWSAMLADDVEYNQPDGDHTTRTKLVGRDAVIGWFTDWKANSGIVSMSADLPVHMPIEAKKKLNMTGLDGVYVLSYFSNTLRYANGNSAGVRMNAAAHFNADRKIDRYWMYYDRAPIIEAQGGNTLKKEETAMK